MKIQGKDYSIYKSDEAPNVVRTYRAEIKRTQQGKIVLFPLSYITLGIDVEFTAPKTIANEIRQICFSHDLVEIETDLYGTAIKGKFSATSITIQNLRDKKEMSAVLSMSLVSDGSDITKPTGQKFTVKKDGITLTSTAKFGALYKLNADAKMKGAKLPNRQILILGDVELTD